jgi:hypothetical protein
VLRRGWVAHRIGLRVAHSGRWSTSPSVAADYSRSWQLGPRHSGPVEWTILKEIGIHNKRRRPREFKSSAAAPDGGFRLLPSFAPARYAGPFPLPMQQWRLRMSATGCNLRRPEKVIPPLTPNHDRKSSLARQRHSCLAGQQSDGAAQQKCYTRGRPITLSPRNALAAQPFPSDRSRSARTTVCLRRPGV